MQQSTFFLNCKTNLNLFYHSLFPVFFCIFCPESANNFFLQYLMPCPSFGKIIRLYFILFFLFLFFKKIFFMNIFYYYIHKNRLFFLFFLLFPKTVHSLQSTAVLTVSKCFAFFLFSSYFSKGLAFYGRRMLMLGSRGSIIMDNLNL